MISLKNYDVNNEASDAYSLRGRVFNKLRENILNGVYDEGEELKEIAIGKELGVSRTPVREAFRQLEADGLIENIPNRGAFVTGLTKRDISDLFDMRTLFEMQAVEWAIKRMDDEDIDVLRETVEFMEFYTLKNDVEKVVAFHSRFHNTIYSGTKDRMIQRTLSTYQTYIKHSAPAKSFSEDYLKTILEEHKAIFAAFEARNVAAGRKAMEYHMEQSKLRRISNYF